MAKLYFRYGTVMSAKSAQLLAVHDNYTRQGKTCLIAKPKLDTRYQSVIGSRLGMSMPASYLLPDNADPEIIHRIGRERPQCLLVDEAQFLSPDWVRYLHEFTVVGGVPVICYGLRADYRGIPFPGAVELFARADVIEEIKTICWMPSCNRKATHNHLYDASAQAPSDHHAAVMVGKMFIPLCSACWFYARLDGSLPDDFTPPTLSDTCRNFLEGSGPEVGE